LRFEKYLSQKPEVSDADKKYRAMIDAILESLSPTRDGGPDIFAAFKMLRQAGSHPGDAAICSTLA
jgi:hypothetical protein